MSCQVAVTVHGPGPGPIRKLLYQDPRPDLLLLGKVACAEAARATGTRPEQWRTRLWQVTQQPTLLPPAIRKDTARDVRRPAGANS